MHRLFHLPTCWWVSCITENENKWSPITSLMRYPRFYAADSHTELCAYERSLSNEKNSFIFLSLSHTLWFLLLRFSWYCLCQAIVYQIHLRDTHKQLIIYLHIDLAVFAMHRRHMHPPLFFFNMSRMITEHLCVFVPHFYKYIAHFRFYFHTAIE